MGPQRKMRIYVGYDSPSIVRYLEPLTGDLFTTCFVDFHFNETVFLSLGGDKHDNVPVERRELSWYASTMSHLDPRTAQSETEVRRIINLQSIAQSMPDAFTDLAKVTRSHIPAANTPTRIDVPRDSQPRNRKMAPTSDPSLNPTIAHSSVPTYEVILDYGDVSNETYRPSENREISVHYTVLDEVWNRNEMIIDNAFLYLVATDIMFSDDIEPCSIDEC
ncbi:hypothetical protein ACFX15_019392 [Malus domestica]